LVLLKKVIQLENKRINIMKMPIKIIVFLSLVSLTMGCNSGKGDTVKDNISESVVEQLSIQGSVGQLKAELQIPVLEQDVKCPLVILMHGFMSDKNYPLLTEIADRLQENGIASIRFDFNGHGESEGEFINMTVPLEVEDAQAVYNYCRNLDFVSNISLAGHSQGGVVASLLGGKLKDAIKSIVLLAPAAVLVDDAKNGTVMGATFDPNNLPEYVNIFNHRVGRKYFKAAQALNIYDKADDFEGPVCLIHGREDQVVPYRYSEKYDEVYKNSTLHLVDCENHMFSEKMTFVATIVVDFFKEQNKIAK
jgi:pimeloyl-ACP methyl ester carboxylesterase